MVVTDTSQRARPGGSGGGLQLVVLVGEAVYTSCWCVWFQFPICPCAHTHSTDFLYFTLGGFLDYGVPLPPTQCVITPGQKCPPDKTTHAISGNWFCDLKRQPGFREVASLSLYSVENGRMPHYHQVETLAPWRVCIQTLVHGHPPPPVPPQTPG